MTWSIIERSLEQGELLNQESLFALGNGTVEAVVNCRN